MDLAPTAFPIGDIGAGNAHAVAYVWNREVRSEASAGGARIGARGGIVIADGFDDEAPASMKRVDKIEDGGAIRIENYVEIAVGFFLDRGDTTFDGRAGCDHHEAIGQINVIPERGVACAKHNIGRTSRIAKAGAKVENRDDSGRDKEALHSSWFNENTEPSLVKTPEEVQRTYVGVETRPQILAN